MRLLDFQVNYMLYWRFHFKKEIPINYLFTQWKWTYMLGFGPWRWSALDMGYMDKRPSFLGKDNRYEGQINPEGQSQWRRRDVEQPCPSCMGSNAKKFEEQRMWWGPSSFVTHDRARCGPFSVPPHHFSRVGSLGEATHVLKRRFWNEVW